MDATVNDSSRYLFTPERPQYWRGIKEISPKLAATLIVSEDSNFYTHHGFDWEMISDNIQNFLSGSDKLRGGSTLTQQLSKNLFLSPSKSLWRKLREIIYTTLMEMTFNKRELLELYLNSVEFGGEIFGINQASNYYFSKSPGDLTPREAAFLIMLLPNPPKYATSFNQKELTPYARKTIANILNFMVIAGHLTDDERKTQLATPFSWEK